MRFKMGSKTCKENTFRHIFVPRAVLNFNQNTDFRLIVDMSRVISGLVLTFQNFGSDFSGILATS